MIIFCLKKHNTATIGELSEYLEVSRRTVCRDIKGDAGSGYPL